MQFNSILVTLIAIWPPAPYQRWHHKCLLW